MREVSNRVIVILITILIIVTLLEFSVYYVRYNEITLKATAVGFVGMCVDNNPVINPIEDQIAHVNQPFYYDVNSTIENDTNVTFYDNTDLFEIDQQTGEISFTPNESDEGDHYINITVFSICGRLSDWKIMKLTIEPENKPPVLDPIPDFVLNQSDTLIYDVNATDPNNDTLTFGDNTTLFEIGNETGLIYFPTAQDDVGNHSVLIWVSDGELVDWQAVHIEVIDINDPPVLDPIGAQTAIINETYAYDVNATDVDVKPEWSNLTFYDNSTFFDIDPVTGLIQFFVNESYNGTYWINISVTDGYLWDEEIISFSVVAVNHPPNITSWYPFNDTIRIYEGQSQYFNITKYDPDGTVPSTLWYVDGTALMHETNDEYTYYASYISAGTHNITVIISDGELTDSHEWTLIIIDVPTVVIPPPTAAPPTCIENWRCSEWSVCPVYEIQTRECVDINNCGTTFNKPEETRSCVYVPIPSCEDGVTNCHHGKCEIWIDCGGPCPPCPTCSDGIKNCHTLRNGNLICEEEIDCGGPCPPCPEVFPPVCGNQICEEGEWFTCIQDCGLFLAEFLLIVILLGAGSVFIYRVSLLLLVFYRKKIRPLPYTDVQLLGTTTLRKLHLIQLEIGKKKLRTIVSEFSGLIREFFAKMFRIRKEFTYIELTEVARRRKIPKGLADRITEFSMKMTEIEYKLTEPSISDISLVVKSAIIIVEKLTGVRMYDALEKRAEKELKRVEPEKEEVKLPKPVPEKRVKKYKITVRDIADAKTLERLISGGERAIANHKLEEAERIYSKIRKVYDEIPPEVKKGLYNETIRIIKLYNRIMSEI